MTKIKLCGLTRAEDISAANELMPDFIGFVFAEKSRRYVSFDRAAELKKSLDRGIKAVGVFVDEPQENILKLVKNEIIDIVQLHGKEDDGYIEELRKKIDKPIIKSFGVSVGFDIERVNASKADIVLIDSASGGSGRSFDRAAISGIRRDFFLAGGLDASNVSEALSYKPYAVDVSSGVETDGYKDKIKMREFVIAVRKHKGEQR